MIGTLAFLYSNSNTEITYTSNNPGAGYGFAALMIWIASAIVFMGSTVVIAVLAAAVLEVRRRRQITNRLTPIKQ
jgi:uncharacterized membrane protein